MADKPTRTLPDSVPTSTTTAAAPAEQKGPEPSSTSDWELVPPNTEKQAWPEWPAVPETHPLSKFRSKLPSLLKEASHSEIYGIDLQTSSTFHQNLILQKFLRANANDLEKASAQLLQTLKWRKQFQPLKTLDETFSAARFDKLGYVIRLKNVPDSPNKDTEKGDVATFNIYGAVKDPKLTFEDIDGFLRWRVALMELSLRELDLQSATKPIPDFNKGPDPYQALQVHDYLQVSFLRQNSYTKAASKQAIAIFRDYYPETLSRKFFVNVPVVMGWMYSAVTMVLSKETVRKFTVLSYGEYLKGHLGEDVPAVYGGTGQELDARALCPKLEAKEEEGEKAKA